MKQTLSDLSHAFKKYNLGCGTHIYRGFLNVGYWRHLTPEGLYKDMNGTKDTFMLNFDLRQGIPAHDCSLSLVYHSHMYEHLSYVEGLAFTRECFRTLAPGGRLRVLVPDLELWIDAYVKGKRFFFEEYRKVLDPEIYVTNCAIFMGMLHNHEHKCGYDYETLKWILERTGFVDVKRTLYGSSTLEDIAMLEAMDPLRIMETLCVECQKPENN